MNSGQSMPTVGRSKHCLTQRRTWAGKFWYRQQERELNKNGAVATTTGQLVLVIVKNLFFFFLR